MNTEIAKVSDSTDCEEKKMDRGKPGQLFQRLRMRIQRFVTRANGTDDVNEFRGTSGEIVRELPVKGKKDECNSKSHQVGTRSFDCVMKEKKMARDAFYMCTLTALRHTFRIQRTNINSGAREKKR